MILFYDFYYIWAAAQLLILGKNPYDHALHSAMMYQGGFLTSESPSFFAYPPWVLPLIAPLGFFSFFSAAIIFLTVIVLGLYIGARCIIELIWPRFQEVSSTTNLLIIAATVSFPPFIKILLWGNGSLLAFVSIALFLKFFHSRKDYLAGIALSFTAIKPNMFLIFYATLALVLIQKRRWAIALSAITAGVVQVACAAILFPSSFSQYADSLSLTTYEFSGLGSSVSNFLSQDSIAPILYATLLIVGVSICWIELRRGIAPLSVFIIWSLPLSAILSPYAWTHDFFATFPLYLAIIASLAGTARSSFIKYVVFFAAQLLVWINLEMNPDISRFTILLPIGVLAVFLLRENKIRSLLNTQFS
jgi:hypothetical protein